VVPGAGLSRFAVIFGAMLALAGCAELTRWDPEPRRQSPSRSTAPAADVHVVQKGDTLFQIAFAHRLDWRDVAAWNRLGDAARIYPGQRIRLTPPTGAASSSTAPRSAASRPEPRSSPPASRTTAPPAVPAPAPRAAAGRAPKWSWPVNGPVVWKFGENRRNPTGIGIGGVQGTEIRAAAEGTVAYSGGGLIGYGMLIIIKHDDSYLSAYGYNQTLMVKEGERVNSGQIIALMGRGPADRPLLHFEIRVDGKPADPARFLPSR
jgi:lipoprotein NlpD